MHSTSIIQIPLKYLIAPLGIRTYVCHVLSSYSVPSHNSACTMATTYNQLEASGVLSRVPEIKKQADVFYSHSSQAARAVPVNPAYRPCNIFVLRDSFIHRELLHPHRYRLSWRWDGPVQLDPLYRNIGDSYSSRGQGVVHGVFVPSSHLIPCLLDERRIRREGGLHCRPYI